MRTLFLKLMILFTMLMVSLSAFAQEAGAVEKPAILVIVFACLFAISEALASLKFLDGNSIFQICKNIIKAIYDSMKK